VRRVSVVGVSGAGKSTLGRCLGAQLGVPFLELDGVFHQPGWTPLPPQDFQARVREVTAGDGWVIDGNYRSAGVQELVWDRADTVVWLDLPRPLVMRRIVRRSLRRAITREELWNGNRESLRNLVRRDPEANIVVWSWRTHAAQVARYEAAMSDPANAHLRFVRLRSPAEVAAFADRL
jgi:adenylate kinase family enzyme